MDLLDINILKEYTEIDESNLEECSLQVPGRVMTIGLELSKAEDILSKKEFEYKAVKATIGIDFRKNYLDLGFCEKNEGLVEDWVNSNKEVKKKYGEYIKAKKLVNDIKAIQIAMIDVRKGLENIGTLMKSGLYVPPEGRV
jgi:hypothetical protein